MAGVRSSEISPKAPNIRNHSSITGPNNLPNLCVPLLCIRNRPIRIATTSGTTSGAKRGVSTVRPSTADKTVMAGVSMPSPKNSANPIMAPMPMVAFTLRVRPWLRCASAASARVPPSPLLSARMMIKTYFIVTTRISAQKIIESEPITAM